MWKAAAGKQFNIKNDAPDDDWETDPDFVNDVTEQEQRWGSATIEGSGRTAGAIDMEKLRRETEESDAIKKKQALIDGPNSSFGYGGKFGVQTDRMDSSAVGHDYVGKVEKHASQKDYSTGFGGKYGVQTDRVDKSAVNWDHKEKLEKHASQKDYASGFGGKYGVQSDRQDKSAVGWDHVEKLEKHESQKDYSKGFGGKFGVQTDRVDKSAVGWDHHEAPQKHESQTDHKIGFGGKFGVQTDRMDKSAVTFNEEPSRVGTNYARTKPDIGDAKPSAYRAKFENMVSQDSAPQIAQPSVTKKNVQARLAMFSNNETTQPQQPPIKNQNQPKQLDQSKTAFLSQTPQPEPPTGERTTPKQLDHAKLTQFTSQEIVSETSNSNKIQQELEELRQSQQQKVVEQNKVIEEPSISNVGQEIKHEDDLYEKFHNTKQVIEATKEVSSLPPETVSAEEPQCIQEDEIVDTGVTAIALYDYQAGAEDEISFDPDDIITHVEMIDEGWWRGLCKGQYGLFPANYVQLQS